jgi:hypothetical protein
LEIVFKIFKENNVNSSCDKELTTKSVNNENNDMDQILKSEIINPILHLNYLPIELNTIMLKQCVKIEKIIMNEYIVDFSENIKNWMCHFISISTINSYDHESLNSSPFLKFEFSIIDLIKREIINDNILKIIKNMEIDESNLNIFDDSVKIIDYVLNYMKLFKDCNLNLLSKLFSKQSKYIFIYYSSKFLFFSKKNILLIKM